MTHPLQTKTWAEFRTEWGNEVEFAEKNLIIFSKIPFIGFTIGTILKSSSITGSDLASIRKIGKKHNAIFIKFEPDVEKSSSLNQLLNKSGLIRGKTLFTPTTFVIDLTKSEEELLKSFSGKTRYNIRLAQKNGVKIIEDNSKKAFETYLKLTFDTAKRQGFYAHTPRYHELMWKHLHEKLKTKDQKPIAHLLTATYRSEVVTTWILFAYDKVLYYPYGASSEKYKNVMANNLMMWEAIKFGKKLGCTSFDLWGREEGKGFTRFKEGYNPKVVEFVGSWNLVINKPLYYLYRCAEYIRWIVLRSKRKILN